MKCVHRIFHESFWEYKTISRKRFEFFLLDSIRIDWAEISLLDSLEYQVETARKLAFRQHWRKCHDARAHCCPQWTTMASNFVATKIVRFFSVFPQKIVLNTPRTNETTFIHRSSAQYTNLAQWVSRIFTWIVISIHCIGLGKQQSSIGFLFLFQKIFRDWMA